MEQRVVHVVIFSFHATHFHTLLTPLDFQYVYTRFDLLTSARFSVSVNEGKSENGGFMQSFPTNSKVVYRSPAPSIFYTELEPEITQTD